MLPPIAVELGEFPTGIGLGKTPALEFWLLSNNLEGAPLDSSLDAFLNLFNNCEVILLIASFFDFVESNLCNNSMSVRIAFSLGV